MTMCSTIESKIEKLRSNEGPIGNDAQEADGPEEQEQDAHRLISHVRAAVHLWRPLDVVGLKRAAANEEGEGGNLYQLAEDEGVAPDDDQEVRNELADDDGVTPDGDQEARSDVGRLPRSSHPRRSSH